MEFETLRMQIADFQGSHTVRIKEVDGEVRVRVLRKILKLLDGMPDTRVQGRITYPLGDLVLMLFLATLAGSDSCLGAADFWMHNARLYKRLFSVLGYRYDIVRDLRIPAEAGFDGLPHLLGVGYHDAACFTGDAHAPLKAVA